MAAMGFMTEPARDAIKRLLESVPDTSAKVMIANVLRFAVPALQSLKEIDKSLNAYFSFYKDDIGDALEMVMAEVRATAFKRVRALIGFLASRGILSLDRPDDDGYEPTDSFDFGEEFDLGAFDESSVETPEFEAESMLEAVDEIDIEAAFESIAPEGEAPPAGGHGMTGMPVGHPPTGPTASGGQSPVDPAAIKRPVGALSVAEVWDRRAELSGTSVTVTGQVVKYNAEILGRNWIHLQDGTGSADDGTNDLTVTTTSSVAVGDVIVVTGTLVVDKDLGSGYFYSVLLEDASIEKN